MNYNKFPHSYQELIDKLCSRGMHIPDRQAAEYFLHFVSYYRFSGYALAFEVKSVLPEKRNHLFKK